MHRYCLECEAVQWHGGYVIMHPWPLLVEDCAMCGHKRYSDRYQHVMQHKLREPIAFRFLDFDGELPHTHALALVGDSRTE